MARHALAYLNTYYQPKTGLVNATPDWPNTTLWDIGGQLLGYHAAKELGLLTQDEFDKRVSTTLSTLKQLELFRNATFNKLYATRTGALGDGGRLGWSATDLGRFMLALKILAIREPQLAADAEAVARRTDLKQVVKDGYLQG